MQECQQCGAYLRTEPDKIGARCPRCREPLYERPGGPRLAAEQTSARERGVCVVHPANVAVGTCQRCGNFVCRVCRTRWADRNLCLACAQRLAREHERGAGDGRTHRRQATRGLVFGLVAWGLVLVGGLLAAAADAVGGLALLAFFFIAASLILAAFGIGQAAAAVRVRGDRMVVAASGLVLSASHVGILSGLFLLALWQL